MEKIKLFKKDLSKLSEPSKAQILQSYFKTEKNGYGHGDKFIGVSVLNQRKLVERYKELRFSEIKILLNSKIHEHRFSALLFLTRKYKEGFRREAVNIYFNNIKNINNWDLVDVSAPKILGDFFLRKDKKELEKMLYSNNLWERRIAIISTLRFIKENELKTTIRFSKILLLDSHDLIHKAVGWMLREVGKKDKGLLVDFIKENVKKMNRTTLRYSIEKFDKKERSYFLSL
jgi:3-methyladenine DNA glycosylase AlkD